MCDLTPVREQVEGWRFGRSEVILEFRKEIVVVPAEVDIVDQERSVFVGEVMMGGHLVVMHGKGG